ncbi:hypothetical protein Q1M63_18695 [Sinorhizobium meliloti]|nr:hypothetical protein Q1M63_18695 [Sinorhizobium meliloti]
MSDQQQACDDAQQRLGESIERQINLFERRQDRARSIVGSGIGHEIPFASIANQGFLLPLALWKTRARRQKHDG